MSEHKFFFKKRKIKLSHVNIDINVTTTQDFSLPMTTRLFICELWTAEGSEESTIYPEKFAWQH